MDVLVVALFRRRWPPPTHGCPSWPSEPSASLLALIPLYLLCTAEHHVRCRRPEAWQASPGHPGRPGRGAGAHGAESLPRDHYGPVRERQDRGQCIDGCPLGFRHRNAGRTGGVLRRRVGAAVRSRSISGSQNCDRDACGNDRVRGAHPDRVTGTHLGLEDGRSGQERQARFTRPSGPSSSSSTRGTGSSRHSSRKCGSGGRAGRASAAVIRSPWKIWPHSLNGRLLVTSRLPRS